MQVAIVGQDNSTSHVTSRLTAAGHECALFSLDGIEDAESCKSEAKWANTLEGMVKSIKKPPRIVWLSISSGAVTERTISVLTNLLHTNDIVVDASTCFYLEAMRRAEVFHQKGVRYVDAGLTGGPEAKEHAYGMMLGGDKTTVDYLEPILSSLAPNGVLAEGTHRGSYLTGAGYSLVGPAGAGHFAKMVYSGIEFGMMQAYVQGIAILCKGASEGQYDDKPLILDIPSLVGMWSRRSMISSRLLHLAAASSPLNAIEA